MATLHLEIVTPSKAVFTGDVTEVTLPGRLGELGILPGHLPLMTLLKPGEILAQTESGPRYFAVGTGFAEVLPGRVLILTDHSDDVDEIDAEAARSSLEALESSALGDDFNSQDERDANDDEIARQRARIELVKRATDTNRQTNLE